MPITLDGIRDIKLYQRREGYRFSADAMLLYDFVGLKYARKIIDLGAGSGVVGILLAKKYPASEVSLIELQETLHGLAEKNIAINGLDDRVKALLCDIREMPGDLTGFDLAVSNPPFRKPKTGRLNIGSERAVARHELSLNLNELLKASSRVLREGGRFCLIHHPQRLIEILDGMKKVGLEPKRLRFVHGNESAEAKMVLIEAVKGGKAGIKVDKPFVVYKEDGGYTDEMNGIYTVKKVV